VSDAPGYISIEFVRDAAADVIGLEAAKFAHRVFLWMRVDGGQL
jgi:hypothetical protein